jgi:hypothetical protein
VTEEQTMVSNQTALDAKGMPMRRSLLITLVALGSLVCLIGSTGLFAALSDAALTGTNEVDSAAVAASADIQLAPATFDPVSEATTCGTFAENLTTGFFDVTAVDPGYGSDLETFDPAFFCIKNVGSQPVTLAAFVTELIDTETACTGDEALHGDSTCGGDGAGELSSVLTVAYNRWDCSTGAFLDGTAETLKDSSAVGGGALFWDALTADAHACFSVYIQYPEDTPAAEIQKAQSDRATWRFTFYAQA